MPQSPEDTARAVSIARSYFGFDGAHLYLRKRNYSDMDIDKMLGKHHLSRNNDELQWIDHVETMRRELQEAMAKLKSEGFPAEDLDDLYDELIEKEETDDKDYIDDIAQAIFGLRKARRYLKNRGYSDLDVERLLEDHLQVRSNLAKKARPRLIVFLSLGVLALGAILWSIFGMDSNSEIAKVCVFAVGVTTFGFFVRNFFFHSV